jgi:hypothetical protein
VEIEIKARACELPSESDLPFSRFRHRDIARQAMARGIVACISGATVWRWLDAAAIKPWYPNAIQVHTPVHASWRNQIEIYFSIVQRKVLTPNDFADLQTLGKRLLDVQAYDEMLAQPFQWKFTRTDLERTVAKRAPYRPQAQKAAA